MGIGLEDMRIADGKYAVISAGSKTRCLAFFRVGISDIAEDKADYSTALKTTLQQQRVRGMFEGLRRASVPFVYMLLTNESESRGMDSENHVLEFDLVVGTWFDAKKKEDGRPTLEQRASVLSATLSVALPTASVTRLVRRDLSEFLKSAFLPGARELPQSAPSGSTGTLCTFDRVSPIVAGGAPAPEYYVPNAREAGMGDIILGPTRSGGTEYHNFGLSFDDLRRHTSLLGMTGSGKSTTAAAIVRQVAERGLPTLVLDWHNEYGQTITEAGGKVLAPGKDEFCLNPLEVGPGSDPVEHIAMVSDIFSDVYHFTHPQAYMFRNALQRRLSESLKEEVPTISALVKTIEAYPLRSAYDNETKVALLRRLVPLTQGQSGRALGGSGVIKMDELLSTTVCVELGHMRDVQSRGVFSDVLLKMIYEEKVKQKGSMDHLTVVEEARNVAPARRPEDPPSIGERMISELRKFGEAMMFVAQFPTHVAAEVVKNSGTKIVHRLAWPDDVALVGDSLCLNEKQREHLTRLRAGEAVVGLERLQKPILVQVRPDYLPVESKSLSFAPES
ncbi:MAG TPA: ATP-binding protein [Nitrososphaerales archaeon]|nr:ATP-binding protein [Nitrososphaerales archaeon]